MSSVEFKKRKKGKGQRRKKTALSFEDAEGDDEEVFQISRSRTVPGDLSSKHKKEKLKKKGSKGRRRKKIHVSDNDPYGDGGQATKAHSNLYLSGGRYDQDSLAALKATTKIIQHTVTTAPEAEAQAEVVEPVADPVQTPADDQAPDDDLPDKMQITAARMKRERMRGVQEGVFIPLDGRSGTGYGRSESKGGLIRDEEDDQVLDVDEDSSGRLMFGDPALQASRKKKQSIRSALELNDLPRADHAQLELENTLLRNAGAKPLPTPHVKTPEDDWNVVKPASKFGAGGAAAAGASKRRLEDLEGSLGVALRKLKDQQSTMQAELQRLDLNIKAEEDNLTKLADSLQGIDAKYQFVQRIRDDLLNCIGCLQEKAPFVKEAVDELNGYRAHRSEEHIAVFQRHLLEEYQEAFGLPAILPLPIGVDKASPEEAQKLAEIAQEQHNKRVKQRQRRRERRKERLGVLHKKRFKQQRRDVDVEAWFFPPLCEPEGYSTDDDSEVEGEFTENRAHLLQDAQLIFDDVHEEFRDWRVVQKCFQEWKDTYAESYKSAFISMEVPKMLAPFVTLEVMSWDAWEKPAFESMQWYAELCEYGQPADGGEMDDDDADFLLVPRLVARVVVPHVVLPMIQNEYNVSSVEKTKAAIALVEDSVNHLQDADEEEFKRVLHTLIEAVTNRLDTEIQLQKQAAERVSVRLFPDASANQADLFTAPVWRFCMRRWWHSLKLLRCMLMWKDVFSEDVVLDLCRKHVQLNLQPLIMRLGLLPAAATDFALRVEHVQLFAHMVHTLLSSLPKHWLQTDCTQPVMPELIQIGSFIDRFRASAQQKSNSANFTGLLERLHLLSQFNIDEVDFSAYG